jgi:hypothetical protein
LPALACRGQSLMRIVALLYQFAVVSCAEMVGETARMTIIYLLEQLFDSDSEYANCNDEIFLFRLAIVMLSFVLADD